MSMTMPATWNLHQKVQVLRGLKLCKLHMTIGLLKKSLKRVCRLILRGRKDLSRLSLFVLLLGWWQAHPSCVTP